MPCPIAQQIRARGDKRRECAGARSPLSPPTGIAHKDVAFALLQLVARGMGYGSCLPLSVGSGTRRACSGPGKHGGSACGAGSTAAFAHCFALMLAAVSRPSGGNQTGRIGDAPSRGRSWATVAAYGPTETLSRMTACATGSFLEVDTAPSPFLPVTSGRVERGGSCP